jgi:S1-C subfamily serine protease
VAERLEPGKPFARAGLRKGDLLTALGGAAVGSPEDFRRRLRRLAAEGGKVTLDLQRDGKALRVDVPLQEGP